MAVQKLFCKLFGTGLAPSGNPQIGQFAHKASAPVESTSAVITVSANTYYGIHLDVAREVECEQ